MNNFYRNSILSALILLSSLFAWGQDDSKKVVDGIIAVVGDNLILKSELEEQYYSYLNSGMPKKDNAKCFVLEELLFQGLLLHQSSVDSLEVTEDQVNQELDRRLRYFIQQIGSEKKLEEFYKKSLPEIKQEMFDPVKNQLLAQRMQSQITSNVRVTPSEVRKYFNRIHEDSIPFMDSEVEVAQIVKKPPVSEESKEPAKDRLREYRERVIKGEDFGTLAYLYSEDPGSAKKNGELGFMDRKELVPEFAAVAFSLDPGEVSGIVESKFGYHLVQMIEKRGQKANVRHILLIPKVTSEDLEKAKHELDTIADKIENIDTLTFEMAAKKYSEDEDSKTNGGKMVNPASQTTKFAVDQLNQIDPGLFFVIDKMEVGDISKPVVMQNPDGSKAYRIVKLLSRTQPHKANLKDDYQRIQDAALAEKESEVMSEWVTRKVSKTYVRIDEAFQNCNYDYPWLSRQEQ